MSLDRLTDRELAGHLDDVADVLGDHLSRPETDLVAEAARRLRRGGGNATAIDCTSAGDIVVTAGGAPGGGRR